MRARGEPQSPVTWLMPLGTILQFMLPRWLTVRIARVAGAIVYLLNKKGRARFEENLRHTLGAGATEAEIARAARRLFVRLVTNYLDLLRTPVLRRRVAKLADYDPRTLDAALAKGRGCIVVTAHIGNWDLAGAILGALGYPISAVVEPVPGGWARTFNRYRSATAMETIPMQDRARISDALERRRLLALVSDRDLTGNGILCPAFDAQRYYPRGPAAYALRFGCPVAVGCLVFQDRPGRPPYFVHVEPLDFTASGDMDADVLELTGAIAHRLNGLIGQFPDQWLVFRAGWQATL
jgi:KDO2-lipid IV(A) lauroyltransferase